MLKIILSSLKRLFGKTFVTNVLMFFKSTKSSLAFIHYFQDGIPSFEGEFVVKK